MLGLHQWLGLAVVALLGVLGVVAPHATAKFVQIAPLGPTGISEIRATYGGLFLAMALSGLLTQNSTVAWVLVLGFAAAALVRSGSALLERSRATHNLLGIGFEAGIALLLLL